jgi:pilus assembly protein Flp/PilA
MKKLINFFKEEEGATAVEYGIMVALIAVVIIATVVIVGTKLNATFKSVADSLPS